MSTPKIQTLLETGINAHKLGALTDAEIIYKEILELEPSHPDANHNLGVLALMVNKPEISLKYFEVALNNKDKKPQFFYSYIDGLLRSNKLDDARALINVASKKGLDAQRLQGYLSTIENSKTYQKILEHNKNIENLAKASKYSEIDVYIKKISKKISNAASIRNKLGELLFYKNQFSDAIIVFEKNTVEHPRYFQSHVNLIKSLIHIKSYAEAFACAQKAFLIDDSDAELIEMLIYLCTKLNRTDLQHLYLQIATSCFPKRSDFHSSHGLLLRSLSRFEDAKAAMLKALELEPKNASLLNNLGLVEQDLKNLTEAKRLFLMALTENPKLGIAYNNIALLEREQGNNKEALTFFLKSLEIDPRNDDALNGLGVLMKELNKPNEAIDYFQRSIQLNHLNTRAHRNISELKTYTETDTQVSQIKKILAEEQLDDDQLSHLHFTLGKAFEDLQDYETSMKHFITGNNHRKVHLKYDISIDIKVFNLIYKMANLLAQVDLNHFTPSNIVPIFILGMPRSGSTLLEQIISSHAEVQGAGELPYLGELVKEAMFDKTNITNNDVINVRNRYLEKIAKLSKNKKYVIDKMPHNFMLVPTIVSAFPEAKILHIHRDPKATCWSNFKHFFSTDGLGYSYSLDDTVEYYKMYVQMMDKWKKNFSDKIIDCNYEELVLRPNDVIRLIVAQLGLPWDEACLSPELNKRAVKTASHLQVRNKIYSGSSKNWENFADFIEIFNEL